VAYNLDIMMRQEGMKFLDKKYIRNGGLNGLKMALSKIGRQPKNNNRSLLSMLKNDREYFGIFNRVYLQLFLLYNQLL